ncbi:four-carbon acid sugar kinase family protein [Actibacterium sp. MT2.3-13A]|uniref:four-carbon acid sugar kinase family protein n=1 Tax=Actibacterium sp. MT2.3-13A TaxID=2828332 RepID=UPI001BA78D34|nr:four-carbon acid sugar kinase family protein [Actibacterium sp. MT2.3-13A]
MVDRWVIIADDLTGALDTAAPIAEHGVPVRAALSPSSLPEVLAAGEGIIAVSTKSRELSADDARKAIRQVLDALPPGARILKKIDSRLKGHISAEVAEALVLGYRRVVAAPAIPDLGRVVEGGLLHGFGITRPLSVSAAFGGLAVPVEVPDITSDMDFDAVLERLAPDTLVAGARGLSVALARKFAPEPSAPRIPRSGRVLVAIGSRDPITLRQVEQLRARGADMAYVACPNGAAPAVQTGRAATILVQLVAGDRDEPREDVTERFAQTLAVLVRRTGADTLIATGGETAQSVLDVLGVATLDVLGEAAPGVPVTRAVFPGGSLNVLTKSGGFGDPGLLVQLLGALRGA